MGGYGSGARCHWWRAPRKTVVEHCRQLDAAGLAREGVLRAGVRAGGGWCWWRSTARPEKGSSVGYEVDTTAEPPWLRIMRLAARLGRAGTSPNVTGLA